MKKMTSFGPDVYLGSATEGHENPVNSKSKIQMFWMDVCKFDTHVQRRVKAWKWALGLDTLDTLEYQMIW